MKLLLLLVWCALISIAGAQVNRLTEQEREEFLERLRQMREVSDSRLEARFRIAIQAYRSAMGSDEATFALYMKCVEKVDFTDRGRRAQDFREWRRNNDDRLKDSAFRRALRHQLRWLVLTLQATPDSADRAQLASSAQEIIDSIVSDASNLTGHQNILNQSVVGSIFARAYEIGNIDVEEWVLSPGQIGAVYDQILMPRYRTTRRTDALRAAWNKRIQQETLLAEEWRGEEDRGRRIGLASAQRGQEFEKFIAEEIPKLQWQMEVDVFKHGDPAGAAPRMLAHLERNVAHSSVREWTSEFEELLSVDDSPVISPQPAAPEAPMPPARPPTQPGPSEPEEPEEPDSIFID